MTNADKFKSIFGLYATELWAKSEKDFLEWLNADAELFGNSEQLDDTISRRAAIDALDKRFDSIQMEQTTEILLLRKDLRNLPSAQTGRKKGKWLPDNNNYYEERFICSVCGKSYKVDTCMGKPMWNFCPCGADMREDDDGNGV